MKEIEKQEVIYTLDENEKLLDIIEKLEKFDSKNVKFKNRIDTEISFNESEIDKDNYVKIIKKLWYNYLDNNIYISLSSIDALYSLLVYKLSLVLKENIIENIITYFKENQNRLFSYFVVYMNWYEINFSIFEDDFYDFISNETFLKWVNSWFFYKWIYSIRLQDVIWKIWDEKSEIYEILKYVYDKDSLELKIKKKKWKLDMLESNFEFDSSSTRYVDLEKNFAHAEITSKVYKNKTTTYKVKELTKLNKKENK